MKKALKPHSRTHFSFPSSCRDALRVSWLNHYISIDYSSLDLAQWYYSGYINSKGFWLLSMASLPQILFKSQCQSSQKHTQTKRKVKRFSHLKCTFFKCKATIFSSTNSKRSLWLDILKVAIK